DIPVFVRPLHDLPQRAQPSTACSGDDQISIERGHALLPSSRRE
ncbi:MAG: hypothetical protein ACI9ME_002001, partial [Ilumatobacter sp.]